MVQIIVSDEEAPCRLDRFLARRLPQVPRHHIQRLLRKGRIRVDSVRASGGYSLVTGASVQLPVWLEKELSASSAGSAVGSGNEQRSRVQQLRSIDRFAKWVMFSNESVVILNKPAGVAVQGGSGITFSIDSCMSALWHLVEEEQGDKDGARKGNLSPSIEAIPELSDIPTVALRKRLLLVHRLDRPTSGLLVLAAGRKIARLLTGEFARRAVAKTYWAITSGVPEQVNGVISSKLPGTGGGAGIEAVTRYRLLAHNEDSSWVELQPITGRKHQLRIHMAMLNCPIIGDSEYGTAHSGRSLMLHARRLQFHDIDVCPPQVASISPEFAKALVRAGWDASIGDGIGADTEQAIQNGES